MYALPITREASEKCILSYRQGEFVNSDRPNGAGKSTLTKLMNGLLKPSSERLPSWVWIRKRQNPAFWPGISAFCSKTPTSRSAKIPLRKKSASGWKQSLQDKTLIEQRVNSIIEQFGFDPSANPALSRGNVGRRLLRSSLPNLKNTVLDEPTTEWIMAVYQNHELHSTVEQSRNYSNHGLP